MYIVQHRYPSTVYNFHNVFVFFTMLKYILTMQNWPALYYENVWFFLSLRSTYLKIYNDDDNTKWISTLLKNVCHFFSSIHLVKVNGSAKKLAPYSETRVWCVWIFFPPLSPAQCVSWCVCVCVLWARARFHTSGTGKRRGMSVTYTINCFVITVFVLFLMRQKCTSSILS